MKQLEFVVNSMKAELSSSKSREKVFLHFESLFESHSSLFAMDKHLRAEKKKENASVAVAAASLVPN